MSELSAAGFPMRSLGVSFIFLASVLLIVFGVGVRRGASQALSAVSSVYS
ncbi:MAG: hypothetical protein M1281_00220 [Chloroflexi bacterium]|nr:hypothetical protein [Chloroflexota bacterium]